MSSRELNRILNTIVFPELPYRSVVKNDDVSSNVNPEICSECGGECCKRCGCEFSPDDFQEITFDFLKTEIEKGYITIEYIDGNMIESIYGVLILRTRNQDSPIVEYIYRKKPCILLTSNGCKLDYSSRPTGGKLLVPSNIIEGTFFKRRKCISSYSLESCCYEWRPHQKVLHKLAEYFKDKSFQCSI